MRCCTSGSDSTALISRFSFSTIGCGRGRAGALMVVDRRGRQIPGERVGDGAGRARQRRIALLGLRRPSAPRMPAGLGCAAASSTRVSIDICNVAGEEVRDRWNPIRDIRHARY